MRSAGSESAAAAPLPSTGSWSLPLPPLPLNGSAAHFGLALGAVGGVLLVAAWRLPLSPSSFETGGILPGLRGWCALLAGVAVALRLPLLAEPRPAPAVARPRAGYVRRVSLPAGAGAMVLGLTLPLRPEVAWIAQCLAAAVALYGVGGARHLRVVLPGLVLLAVPAFLGLTERALAGALQRVAAEFSTAFYGSALSGRYERDGFSLRLLSAEIGRPSSAPLVVTVAPECGGYRSLCGLSIAALLFASHPALPGKRKLLLFVAAVVLAFALNLSRLAVTLSLYHWGRDRLARGAAHALLGQAVLAVGVFCLYVAFRALLHYRPGPDPQEVTAC